MENRAHALAAGLFVIFLVQQQQSLPCGLLEERLRATNIFWCRIPYYRS